MPVLGSTQLLCFVVDGAQHADGLHLSLGGGHRHVLLHRRNDDSCSVLQALILGALAPPRLHTLCGRALSARSAGLCELACWGFTSRMAAAHRADVGVLSDHQILKNTGIVVQGLTGAGHRMEGAAWRRFDNVHWRSCKAMATDIRVAACIDEHGHREDW